jgi:hypothetical protein
MAAATLDPFRVLLVESMRLPSSPHLTDGLVQGLVGVWCPPEELWRVQHTAQQVDSRLQGKRGMGSSGRAIFGSVCYT